MLVSTPIGPLTLEASDRGLTRVTFGDIGGPTTPLLIDAAAQLHEYFAGERLLFDVPLDVPPGGFQRDVQRALEGIPYGDTVSYAHLAEQCGSPRAVRAVGSACATNPLPIIRPCHRVLRSDGSLGGYAGGLEAKTWLLEHEQRVLGNRRAT